MTENGIRTAAPVWTRRTHEVGGHRKLGILVPLRVLVVLTKRTKPTIVLRLANRE